MLKKHFAFVNFLRIALDAFIVAILWNASYILRFYTGWFSYSDIPSYQQHLLLTIPVIIIIALCRKWAGIYDSIRSQPASMQFRNQIQSIVTGFLFTIAFLYFAKKVPYTRVLLTLFFFMLMSGLLLSHAILMTVLRYIRFKGFNQRHYAIIGTGRNALRLLRDIEKQGYFGLQCSFLIDDKPGLEGKTISGVPVYGDIEKLSVLIRKYNIDEIYMAKSGAKNQQIYSILEQIQATGMTIRILPDWGRLWKISRPTSVTIGSSLLFTAAESPLDGMNTIIKDIFDRTVSLLLLMILALPMLLIAFLIKLTSKGPVFYKQIRVGMDNRIFMILKFRTMNVNADGQAEWTIRNDSRRTKIGAFLRASSLDELPQLINVLMGHMSLVGPRPEQPKFVKEFSEEYKRYMFRHKVKSGMTGLAQINGFRGDSSLRKRIQYDLFYIRNWSIWLDLLILLRTPVHILARKNAY